MEDFDGGLGAALAGDSHWLRAHLVEHHVVAVLRRLWLAVGGEYGDVVLLLDAHDFDVQRGHLSIQTYLAHRWNVVD